LAKKYAFFKPLTEKMCKNRGLISEDLPKMAEKWHI